MSQTLLLIGPLLPSVMDTLETSYTVHRYWEAGNKEALLQKIAGECEGVVTDGGRGVDNEVLDTLPNVRLVAVFGVGVDAIDLDYCRANGIAVSNTPDVLSDDVADMAMALALAISRQLVNGDQYARAGRWAEEGPMPLTCRVSGKRAGIYGMGSIGRALARRLEGFGMDISYCNRSERNDSSYRFVASLNELAEQVDFLFITAAATPENVAAVDAGVLNALGAEGYLINVARGSLVDEPALVSFLEERKIAGAGLDVFADEPAIPEALLTLDNVVVQPHHASGTRETREAMGKLVLDNVAACFAGTPLLTPVD